MKNSKGTQTKPKRPIYPITRENIAAILSFYFPEVENGQNFEKLFTDVSGNKSISIEIMERCCRKIRPHIQLVYNVYASQSACVLLRNALHAFYSPRWDGAKLSSERNNLIKQLQEAHQQLIAAKKMKLKAMQQDAVFLATH